MSCSEPFGEKILTTEISFSLTKLIGSHARNAEESHSLRHRSCTQTRTFCSPCGTNRNMTSRLTTITKTQDAGTGRTNWSDASFRRNSCTRMGTIQGDDPQIRARRIGYRGLQTQTKSGEFASDEARMHGGCDVRGRDDFGYRTNLPFGPSRSVELKHADSRSTLSFHSLHGKFRRD